MARDPSRYFRSEYDRINRTVYGGALPPFPGVELVDRTDIFSMTCTLGAGPWRRLQPFQLSRHVTGDLLAEAVRHLDDEDHGPAWQHHARLVGASGAVTLDEGHPLRSAWPSEARGPRLGLPAGGFA